jgi:hypothetical protein
MRSTSKALLLLGLTMAVSSSACADFADVTTVVDLRVLAVDTDPSEIFLKVDGLPDSVPATAAGLAALSAVTIDPTSIPVIHLRPLLPDPPATAAGRAVTWTLVGCPNDPYGAAPPGGGGMMAANPGGGAYTTVGSSLCPDPTTPSRSDPSKPGAWNLSGATPLAAGATLDVTLTTDQLLQAFKADVFFDQHGNLHGGFDLGMPINFQLSVSDGTPGVAPLQAIKRVVFWSRQMKDQTTPNALPKIPNVTSFSDRDTDTWALTGTQATLDPAAPSHVPLDKGIWLSPMAATAEMYTPIVIDRNSPDAVVEAPTVKEHIRYAYYATAGHFSPALTSSDLAAGIQVPPGVPPGTVHLESQYIPPATLDGVPVDTATGLHLVTVWIVVRDDRGGETWVQYQLALDGS